MLDQKILRQADKVYRKVSNKDGILYKVAHSRRANKSKTYSSRKILEAYESNLPEYHQSRKKAVEEIGVTIQEATAVYLYLQHQPPGQRDEKLFSEAWGIVCQFAEPLVRQRDYGSTLRPQTGNNPNRPQTT